MSAIAMFFLIGFRWIDRTARPMPLLLVIRCAVIYSGLQNVQNCIHLRSPIFRLPPKVWLAAAVQNCFGHRFLVTAKLTLQSFLKSGLIGLRSTIKPDFPPMQNCTQRAHLQNNTLCYRWAIVSGWALPAAPAVKRLTIRHRLSDIWFM